MLTPPCAILHTPALGRSIGWWPLALLMLTAWSLTACQSHSPRPDQAYQAATEQVGQATTTRLSAEELHSIRQNISSLREKYGVPGLSVALFDDQGLLWSDGFGYADNNESRPATAQTVYRVGSLAKPLTALAVMQLADQGEVDIDQPLFAYLEGFSTQTRFTQADPITLRQILHHHSGLPGNITKGMWSDQRFEQVKVTMKGEYPAYPPDYVFGYSNVGYSLLGHMIEQVSGENFEGHMQHAIFEPLGMGASFYGSEIKHRTADLARGHDGVDVAESPPIRDLPALGLYSNVLDLARLGTALLRDGEGILTPGSFEEMIEVQNADIPLDIQRRVGLGWFLDKGRLAGIDRVVSHGGNTLYFGSYLLLLPDQKLGAVVLGNSRNSRRVAQRIAEDSLAGLLRARFGLDAFSSPTRQATIVPAWGSEGQGEPEIMSGHFATQMGLIEIDSDQGEACDCLQGRSLDTVALPGGRFILQGRSGPSASNQNKVLERVQYSTRRISGKDVILAHLGGRTEVIGEKAPQTDIPVEWQQRMGRYRLSNPDQYFPVTDIALKERGGHLCLSYRMPRLTDAVIQVPLTPVSPTQAIIMGLGRDRGEIVQIVSRDGTEQLCFQGYEAEQKTAH